METTSSNMSLMIHMGVEIVMFGGLTFWFHKRTTEQQNQITSLIEKVNRYEELLKRQGEMVAMHENALRQLSTLLQNESKTAPPRTRKIPAPLPVLNRREWADRPLLDEEVETLPINSTAEESEYDTDEKTKCISKKKHVDLL